MDGLSICPSLLPFRHYSSPTPCAAGGATELVIPPAGTTTVVETTSSWPIRVTHSYGSGMVHR